MIAYGPTDSHKSFRVKYLVSATQGSTVTEVPKGEHLLAMMDDNARTGARGEGCVDDKVLGAYGLDTLNDNGRRLLAFSARKSTCSCQYCFQRTQAWNLINSPNRGKGRYRLDFILTRTQTDDMCEMSLFVDLLQ